MDKNTPRSIDEYIAGFSGDVHDRLVKVRELVKSVVPEALEKISYQMPTFYLNGNLVHFAAFANHIGLYPTPTGIEAFQKDLSVYKQGKGSVQFPHTEPLPLDLIRRIVEYRAGEARSKAGRK